MDIFDIKQYLVENRMTENSRGNEHRNRFKTLKEGFRVKKLYDDHHDPDYDEGWMEERPGEDPFEMTNGMNESGDRMYLDPDGKEIKEDVYDHHDPDYDEGWMEERPGEDPFDINEVSLTGDEVNDDDFVDPEELDTIGTPKNDFKDDMPADDEDEETPEDVPADDNPEEIEAFCNEIESRYPGEIDWKDTDRLHMLMKGRSSSIDKVRAERFWNKGIKPIWDYFKEYDYPKQSLDLDFKYTKGEEEDEEGNNGYIFKRILPNPLCRVYRPEGCYPEYDDDGNLIRK